MAANKPFWHNPAWITAMVGLVSVFLTVPGVVGNYLTKKQDIDLAKEKRRAAELENTASKQDQEFKIVENTLSLQGKERVFLLRYLAATLDDEDAKSWARQEVIRLDDIASRQEALDKERADYESKRKELIELEDDNDTRHDTLVGELERLRVNLEEKNAEISKLEQEAGLVETEFGHFLRIRIEKNPQYAGNGNYVWIKTGSLGMDCFFGDDYCETFLRLAPPSEISINVRTLSEEREDESKRYDVELFGALYVTSYLEHPNPLFAEFVRTRDVRYICKSRVDAVRCTRDSIPR